MSLGVLTTSSNNIGSSAIAETANAPVLPQVSLSQTANMKLAFLGIPADYIDQEMLLSYLHHTFLQFDSDPYPMAWKLNFSFVFYPFPQNISSSLSDNVLYSAGSVCFNTTLLDDLLSQSQELAIPQCGCLLAFMWIPNEIGHQWFYIPQDTPDVLFNATIYDNGILQASSGFTQDFGGLRRAVYFDVSQMMEQVPTESLVTSTVMSLVDSSLRDIFPDMLGTALGSSWVPADVQTYQNYTVKILWINGTGEQLPIGIVQQGLEDLMPWTNWTVTEQTEPADATLNSLVENRTTELATPSNITIVLSNGTRFVLETRRSLNWNWNEADPINAYFIHNLQSYFNLTGFEDKSVIPVILLQLDNDTASLGGITLFPDDLILIGAQGSFLTDMGGYGLFEAMHILKHEVGHWVGLTHHQDSAARMICPMHASGPEVEGGAAFCAFCKDARARMSFMSYYNQTISLLSSNHAETQELASKLNDSLTLFYNWDYTEAVEKIASIYYAPDTTPPTIANVTQTPLKDDVRPEDAINVTATVIDELSGVKSVVLNYTSGNGTWNAINMTNLLGNVWNATIPPFPYGTNVTYVIAAEDNFNNSITSNESGVEYQYQVLPEFPVLLLVPIFIIATLITAASFGKNFKFRKKGT